MFERIIESLRNRLVQLIVVSTIALFAVMTVGFGRGGISGASIGEWNKVIRARTADYSGIQVGVSRPIRVDEWAVSLPFVFAQCRSNEFFPRINSRVNGGTDMFVETPCAPVWDWTAFGQFHNWGYFLFGERHGLAWSWWSRYMLVPLFAFLFFLGWCNGDEMLAGVGAVAVTLGAPAQWWDTTIPYHLAYFFSSLVFFRQIFAVRSAVCAALSAFALFVSFSSYCFVMYPPFSLLLLPVLVILAVFEVRSLESSVAMSRIVLALMSAICVVAELAYFFVAHIDTLRIVGASSYPGARVIRGGSFKFLCERSILDLMSCCTPFFAAHSRVNSCQAAEYVGISMPLFCGIAWASFRKRFDGAVLSLLACIVVMLAWSAFQWPEFLARCTGLYLIPPPRASVIAGFVVLLSSLRWVALADRDGGDLSTPRWWAAVAIGIFLVSRIVAFFMSYDIWRWLCSSWAKKSLLYAGAVLTVALSWSLLRGSKKLFVASLAVFSVMTGGFVHPLVEGVSPLYDKVLSRVIEEIDAKKPGIWISNDRILSQLPVALGLSAWAGTQQYCDIRFWQAVDPTQRWKRVWNRYGHRFIENLNGKGEPDNRKRVDTIFFPLDESKVRRLGIRYVIWRGKPLRQPWLRNIANVKNDHIYEVKPKPRMSRGRHGK